MRGTKRAAISDSAPNFNSNDSFSKRVTMGSLFDSQKAEPLVSLDMKRAESSTQHVRALNAQFASWVQSQIQNHPDELWEDGVQDYLNHAKSIMEKFSDVVNWLKANAAKGESLGELHSNDAKSRPASEIEKSSSKLFLDRPGFPAFSAVTSPTIGSPWNPGNIFNNNSPSIFGGSQVSVLGNTNAGPSTASTNEENGEDDIEQPSSPSLKKGQEEGICVVHEVRCKLYVKSSDPEDKDAWKDRGMGQLSIKCKEGVSKGSNESKPTIIIRNDVGKVLLNALIYPGIKTNVQKNSVVAIFHTSADGDNNGAAVARTFLMRTKTEDDRDKLAAVIQEYAPSA